MTAHLGYEKRAQEGRNGGNSRNRKTGKRVKTDSAEFEIEVPRDREGTTLENLARLSSSRTTFSTPRLPPPSAAGA